VPLELSEWLESNVFHHSAFADKAKLVEQKRQKNLRISLAFPTLNEEKTIGKQIVTIGAELQKRYPLLDEIAVIDSGSEDRTCEIARRFGARVFHSADILPSYGFHRGKGENLWKSLYVLSGDIIVWIDADIANIHPRFVYALVGPLLENDSIGYVKAFYERPYRSNERVRAGEGGRVTEILIRPLINAFFPELAGFVQPLSGEYAGRREILESVPFSVGYGVETGLLIDIYEKFGLGALAQVDLDRRIHRHQALAALRKMSFAILHTFLARLQQHSKVKFLDEAGKEMRLLKILQDKYFFDSETVEIVERPAMRSVPEYLRSLRKPPKEIVLVRHGQTNWNREGKIQGETDIPLNAEGMRQAKEVAKKVTAEDITYLFSSPLKRALKTAQVISKRAHLEVVVDERLREMSQGGWNGRKTEELEKESASYRRFQKDPTSATPPGGESVYDLFRRVQAFLAERIESLEGRIVIVAHKVVLAMIAAVVAEHKRRGKGTSIRSLREKEMEGILRSLWRYLPENAEVLTIKW